MYTSQQKTKRISSPSTSCQVGQRTTMSSISMKRAILLQTCIVSTMVKTCKKPVQKSSVESLTITDRAKVKHATIQRLELSWRKSLKCQLHPLDTIASSIRSTLKECEPSPMTKKLFGYESIAHQLILAINKFRFKDGKCWVTQGFVTT